MLHHPGVALGQKGDKKRAAAIGDMVKANLVAEDRLALPGRALQDEQPAAKKAAAQNCVQARGAGGQAFGDRPGLSVAIALCGVQRQSHGKGRARRRGAGDAHLSFQGADELMRDPQPDAEPRLQARPAQAVEALENMRLINFGNSYSVIAN